MKHTLLLMALMGASVSLHAQQESTVPAQDTAASTMAAPTPAQRPRAASAQPCVAGNAATFVALVDGKGDCRPGTTAVAIRNTSPDKAILAIVEMAVMNNGHMNTKDIRVDNLGINELRNLGCKGCINHVTGQTCTRYRIKAAVFK